MMIVLLFVSGGSFAEAVTGVLEKPAQREYIVDTAGMVTVEDRQRITKIGENLRTQTKAEIVVVTIDTLEGRDIETYANELFRRWGLGDEKLNNGVLLLIVKADRKFRIEVGYGLEGEITDGRSGEILDGMKNDFRQGNYSGGILDAYRKLTAYAYHAVGEAPSAEVDGVLDSAAKPEEDEDGEDSILMNVFLFFLAVVGMILMGIVLYWLLDIFDRALGPGGGGGGSSWRGRWGRGGRTVGGGDVPVPRHADISGLPRRKKKRALDLTHRAGDGVPHLLRTGGDPYPHGLAARVEEARHRAVVDQ